MGKGLYRRAIRYLGRYKRLDRNIHLMLLASSLGGLSYAIFSVIFNLYILSLGIGADVLGMAIAAVVAGSLLAKNDYTTPFCLSAGAMALAGVLNHIFFHSVATKTIESASSQAS